jgi:adenylate kinase
MMKKNLIFLGAPGSGKGTQAQILQAKAGYCHLATGDLLREAMKTKSELGNKVEEYVNNGELVPDSVIIELVEDKFSKEADLKEKGFILDGFPRTIKQAELLKSLLAKYQLEIESVLFFDVDLQTVTDRVMSRMTCGKCNQVYNLISKVPEKKDICDSCGGELKRRADDTEEKIKKRFEIYKEQTEPLLGYYKDVLINLAAKDEPEEIFKSLNKTLLIDYNKKPSF